MNASRPYYNIVEMHQKARKRIKELRRRRKQDRLASDFDALEEAWPLDTDEELEVKAITRSGLTTVPAQGVVPEAPTDRKLWKKFIEVIPGYADLSKRRRRKNQKREREETRPKRDKTPSDISAASNGR